MYVSRKAICPVEFLEPKAKSAARTRRSSSQSIRSDRRQDDWRIFDSRTTGDATASRS